MHDELDLDGWVTPDDTPQDDTPQDDTPQDGTPQDDTPQDDTPPAPKAKAKAKAKAKPKPKTKRSTKTAEPPTTDKGAAGENMARRLQRCKKVEVMIHEMESPPPGGVPVIIGGYSFHIYPGKWVKVPEPVLEVLEHARETKPVVQNGNIVGYNTVPRYPFSVRECKQ